MDCIFFEAFQEEQELLKEFLPKNINAEFTLKTIQEYGKQKPPASLISIRTQSTIPQDWSKKLKGILTRSVGYDHLLDYRKHTKTNIPCGYLPRYCARAVAEQAILVSLALLRKLKTQVKNFDSFHRDGLTGLECKGRNLLIVGVGNIGSQVVDIAKGLGINIKGVDIDPKVKNIKYVSLKKGLPWADIIICALPLTSLTRNMFDYDVLKRAKRGVIFVNIARGEISPLKDLQRLLKRGILGGLGLDVYENENRLADYLRNKNTKRNEGIKIVLELKNKENCIFTPHNAFNTEEAVVKKAKQSIEAIEAFLKKGQFPNPIPKE